MGADDGVGGGGLGPAPLDDGLALGRSSGASPWSPFVATTRTTRWPSLTARAIEPADCEASSSGWAWTKTTVDMASASHRAADVPVTGDASGATGSV